MKASLVDQAVQVRQTDVAARRPVEGQRRSTGVAWVSAIPFVALHAVPLLALFIGLTPLDVMLAVVLYATRMFFVTAGYHRYFSHRAYRLSRPAQLVMAVGGITAAQKGPLWWASHHRAHHRYADTDRDPHSPSRGLWWSHAGWILSKGSKSTDLRLVDDLRKFPELRAIDRLQWLGPWALGLLCFAVAGGRGVVVFALSTVALWHGTFLVNSLAHRFGRRRYATSDDSRNSLLIALVTLGEGWHNNHHHYPPSARQGFFWWEFDPTYYLLKTLAAVRVVRGLKGPSERVRRHRLVPDS
jgi:stearoyl-CoA desaturase (delta-9 desaturase)